MTSGRCPAKNSRNRIPARSLAQQLALVASPRQPGPAGSWVPRLVAALIIRKAPAHRRFGRKTLGTDFVEVVAALGTGVSVILPSLMIGIDQRIVLIGLADRGRQKDIGPGEGGARAEPSAMLGSCS